MRFRFRFSTAVILLVLTLLLTTSQVQKRSLVQKIYNLASPFAFDYATWTREAIWLKLNIAAIESPNYINPKSQHQIVLDYLNLVDEHNQITQEIDLIFADPNVSDPQEASSNLRSKQAMVTRSLLNLGPFAESVLEYQITQAINESGLTLGGQPIPVVLYHVTALPQNLVISRRDLIAQETSYLLNPELTTEQATQLENQIDSSLNVSSLVVPVGGIALYPTMVMRTSALDWLTQVIAHEWIHLYLEQRPLGMNYSTTSELRTMNETVASIAGEELGKWVLKTYYPEYGFNPAKKINLKPSQNNFDFREEMHITRIKADELLAAGKIEEAEAYMESRRQIFWENGYAIRKLNQAYFAFYGAYAASPGGAAGEDPVGPAVRELRARSASLKEFLEIIAQMDSFEDLKRELENTND